MPAGEAGFAGRTVVVTGATAGVGRAVVMRFARAGACLGLIARGEDALRELKAELSRQGVAAATAAIDVADAEAVFAAAARFEADLGPIALWVNDAMVTVFAPVAAITPEEFRRVTEVTYLGCVHGTMAALKHMRPRGHGRIVQVGSALAYRGIPLQAAYCGAKHAIRGFTASLRAELLHENSAIRVSIVELPAVNTPQFDWARTRMSHAPRPVPPVVQPEAVGEAIHRAATQGGAEYWLGRSTPLVVLGNMLLPGLIDRYLARTAYAGQQTPEPVLPGRRDNLDRPVPDLHRIRGSFGAESHGWAPLLPARAARLAAAGGALAVTFALGLLCGRADRH